MFLLVFVAYLLSHLCLHTFSAITGIKSGTSVHVILVYLQRAVWYLSAQNNRTTDAVSLWTSKVKFIMEWVFLPKVSWRHYPKLESLLLNWSIWLALIWIQSPRNVKPCPRQWLIFSTLCDSPCTLLFKFNFSGKYGASSSFHTMNDLCVSWIVSLLEGPD